MPDLDADTRRAAGGAMEACLGRAAKEEGMAETKTLADEFVAQQARLRTLIGYAKEIGLVGAFYVAVCEDLLRRMDHAAMEQDLPTMIALVQEAREIKE